MLNFLLMPTLLFLAAMIAVHWWTGVRPQAGVDPGLLSAALELRKQALADWRKENRKAAASRASTLRFGMGAPPFGLLIAFVAVLTIKVPATAAIVAVLLLTALASVFGFITAPSEIAAIKRFPKTRNVPEQIRGLAFAEVWNQSLPPTLRIFFGPKRVK